MTLWTHGGPPLHQCRCFCHVGSISSLFFTCYGLSHPRFSRTCPFFSTINISSPLSDHHSLFFCEQHPTSFFSFFLFPHFTLFSLNIIILRKKQANNGWSYYEWSLSSISSGSSYFRWCKSLRCSSLYAVPTLFIRKIFSLYFCLVFSWTSSSKKV